MRVRRLMRLWRRLSYLVARGQVGIALDLAASDMW